MPNIRHELFIGAPVEKVYQAITSQEGLSAWWTPQTTASPAIGSILRFSFGAEYFKEMEVTALEPFELVTWNCRAGFHEWVGTDISFRLFAGDRDSLLKAHPEAAGQIVDGGVLLKFEHNNWREDTAMYAECNYTWGQFLRSLKLFCQTGKGTPWPNQHS